MPPIEHPRPRSRAAVLAALGRALVICTAALAGITAPAAAQQTGGRTVLLVSDLHFDPFTAGAGVVRTLRSTPTSGWVRVLQTSTDTAPSAYGSDSDYPLLRSAGNAMRLRVPHPAFVVITGDFLGHSFESKYDSVFGDTAGVAAFADSTMAFMARWFGSLFPADVPMYPSIGNNDSGCNDYGPTPNFLQSAARSWAPLAMRGGGAPGFLAAFDSGGYYTARPPRAGVTLVMMNDIYWSRSFNTTCGPDQGQRELQWVGRTLNSVRAAGGRAWLAAHIPPGADVYASVQHPDTPKMMLAQPYLAPWDSLVRANAGAVALQLTGHTHMDEFRVYTNGAGGRSVPDVGIPAVSPVFGNNPGFMTLRLGPAGNVLDYTAYAYTYPSSGRRGTWGTLFSFRTLYRQPSVTGATMSAAARLIASSPVVRAGWMRAYAGGAAGQNPTAQNWHGYWCAIQNLEPAAFTACANQPPPTP